MARIVAGFILFSASYQGQVIPLCPTVVDDGLSQVALVVKDLPAVQKIPRCRFSPGVGKVPWREGTAAHSRILAWRIPGHSRQGHKESDTPEMT